MTLLDILILFIVLAVVIYGATLIIGMLALPDPIRQLVYLVIAVVVLIIILQVFTGGGISLNRQVT